MDWSDRAAWLLMAALATIVFLYLRLMRKNKRLHQLANEANRQRRIAEETEQRNRQLKQEMTSNIAHELKTPVSSIRGFLEILINRSLDETRRHDYLERCYKQTLRLSDLIADVSLINKIEESTDLFPKTDIYIDRIAQEAIDELSEKASASSITIENRLGNLPIHGNHELIFCIFRNLIENSVTYAGRGVQIVIETYEVPHHPGVAVEPNNYHLHYYDTGNGVPDEYLSRLFDRFVRIGEGRSRRDGGTGLGLSIVKHAVQFHGGEIYAKNRPQGGLEYYFSLNKQ